MSRLSPRLRTGILGLCLLFAAGTGGLALAEERLEAGLYPPAPWVLPEPPPEPLGRFLTPEWTLGLRGSFSESSSAGGRFEALVIPGVSLTHEGRRASIAFRGEATISAPLGGEVELRGLDIGAEGRYALDADTTLDAGARLALSRPGLGDPGVPADVAVPASELSGAVGLGIAREFGRFTAALSGSAERRLHGPTRGQDGVETPNHDQDMWSLEGGLRLGYRITPILEVFGTASAGRELMDHASTTLGERLDATDLAFSAGVLGRWGGVFEAEISAGAGLRRFDAAAIAEIRTSLFEARLTYAPDPTLRLSAAARTRLEPAGIGGPGVARVTTSAEAGVEYTLNSRLRLRAGADWRNAKFVGTDTVETGHGASLGADYALNAHARLSADYGFSHTERTGVLPEDTHRFTLGITLSR